MAEGIGRRLTGRRSRALAHGIALVVAGAVAAPAAGATFHVTQAGEDASANATGCPVISPCSLKNALAQAALASNPGLDVIEIGGPFTTAFTNGAGIFVGDASQPVDLRGSGRGAGGTAISFEGGGISLVTGSSVADASFTGASNVLHLDGGAAARHVGVTTTNTSAFAASGGCCTVGDTILDDVQISTPAGSTGSALVLNPPAGGSVTATDLDLHAAATDVEASGDGKVVVQRARMTGTRCLFETTAPLFASSVLCRSDAGNPAVEAHKSLDLRDATIVGTSGSAMRGVETFSGAAATVAGSLVRGFSIDVQRGGGSTLSIGTSDFHNTSGTPTQSGGNLDVDPQFADAPGGDYRLLRGSLVVDAAGSDPFAPSESATDLRGLPRTDPSGIRDMGAFERQPVAAAISASPNPAPAGAAGASTTVAPAVDRTPPTITASLSATRFVVGRGSSPFSARTGRRLPKGTSIRVALSEQATVRFGVLRTLPGRRSGARCVAPTRRTTHARRCTRAVLRGTLARGLPAGPSSVPFTGRIGRRALPAGSYTLEIRAADAAGNDATPTTLAFTIAHG